eukprot:3236348-Prymnesium_polylepis.1
MASPAASCFTRRPPSTTPDGSAPCPKASLFARTSSRLRPSAPSHSWTASLANSADSSQRVWKSSAASVDSLRCRSSSVARASGPSSSMSVRTHAALGERAHC